MVCLIIQWTQFVLTLPEVLQPLALKWRPEWHFQQFHYQALMMLAVMRSLDLERWRRPREVLGQAPVTFLTDLHVLVLGLLTDHSVAQQQKAQQLLAIEPRVPVLMVMLNLMLNLMLNVGWLMQALVPWSQVMMLLLKRVAALQWLEYHLRCGRLIQK